MAKEKTHKVRPQLLKGFRDYQPGEQIARELMLAKVRDVVELMGFLPLQTASLELAETLLGSHYSSDSLAELFGFKGPDEVDMALRYEFTLSLARYVASQPDLALPFRRYQYGNVWRVDKPGPGRFREFMQFDIDIVGTQNLLADAEIIAAMVSILNALGVKDFQVRFSNRKLLNGIIEWAGIPEAQGPDVLRVLDKFQKIGKGAVLLELTEGRVDLSGDRIPGVGLSSSQAEKIVVDFLGCVLAPPQGATSFLSAYRHDYRLIDEGLNELEQIENYLKYLGVSSEHACKDLLIVRGLGYYTGTVFETYLTKLYSFGSIFSGGRYDNLVERFSNKSFPAVGSSIGVDRLLAALIELKALRLSSSTSKVLVTVMDRDRVADYLKILHELRSAGIPSEIYSGDTKNLTKQIKYGDKVGIPFAVIAGSDEFAAGQITVKNLIKGRARGEETADRDQWLAAEGFQERIPLIDLIEYLRKHLAEVEQ